MSRHALTLSCTIGGLGCALLAFCLLLSGCAGLGDSRQGPFAQRPTPARDGSYDNQLAKAHNREKAGKLEKARDIYQRLLEQQPQRYEAFHRLGVVSNMQRRHQQAQTLLTDAARRDPTNAQVLNDLGYCYFLQNKLSKAESALLKATKLAPARARYRNNLGMVYGHLGENEKSLTEFRQAGSEADAQYNLAFVLASQEKFAEAKERFRRALVADPTHEKARRALANFEQYEADPAAAEEADLLADGKNYVPYVETAAGQPAATPGPVQQASHTQPLPPPTAGQPAGTTAAGGATTNSGVSLPRQAVDATRALHQRAQSLIQQYQSH